MFIRQPLKTQHPKDMTSWTGMQHNLTLKLWTTQANSSWASHMEMLSAAVFLQRCKDLSAPPRVYCHACNTSVQCGNPWVQKTRLVSPNKKEQVPTFQNSLEGIKYLWTSKATGGKARWEKWYLRVITRLPHFSALFCQSLFPIYAPFIYGPTAAPNQDVSGKQIKSSSVEFRPAFPTSLSLQPLDPHTWGLAETWTAQGSSMELLSPKIALFPPECSGHCSRYHLPSSSHSVSIKDTTAATPGHFKIELKTYGLNLTSWFRESVIFLSTQT